jgi:hypothetical protein
MHTIVIDTDIGLVNARQAYSIDVDQSDIVKHVCVWRHTQRLLSFNTKCILSLNHTDAVFALNDGIHSFGAALHGSVKERKEDSRTLRIVLMMDDSVSVITLDYRDKHVCEMSNGKAQNSTCHLGSVVLENQVDWLRASVVIHMRTTAASNQHCEEEEEN